LKGENYLDVRRDLDTPAATGKELKGENYLDVRRDLDTPAATGKELKVLLPCRRSWATFPTSQQLGKN
jgi:hypothetical protein